MLSEQIFYPFTTEPKRFHNKTKVLKQQTKALSQQNKRSETTKPKRFRNKTKGLKQQNKSTFATRPKLLNAKTQSSSALKR